MTFTTQPAENDIILEFPSSTQPTTITTPAGWASVLGGNTDVNADSCESAGLYHRVTAAEAVATKTYTMTDLYPTGQVGHVVGCIVRGVHTTNALAGVGTLFDSNNAATPHILAGVTTDRHRRAGHRQRRQGRRRPYTDPTGWTLRSSPAGSVHRPMVGLLQHAVGQRHPDRRRQPSHRR